MQRDFTTPCSYIVLYFWCYYDNLPKWTKTRLKWHEIAHKTSKHRFRRGLTPLGSLYTMLPQTLYSRLGNWINFYHYRPISTVTSRPVSPPWKKTIFCITAVVNTMRQRMTAIAQSLLHKTTRYFVENRNENTNKQALLQRSRVACMHTEKRCCIHWRQLTLPTNSSPVAQHFCSGTSNLFRL